MARGDEVLELNRAQRAMVAAAVDHAEQHTGLQFCVYLGDLAEDDPRADAEGKFVAQGLHGRPAVLVVVAPKQRRIEIVTSEHARRRIPDADAATALDEMTRLFQAGQLCQGILDGIAHLERAAGYADPIAGEEEELPDVLRA